MEQAHIDGIELWHIHNTNVWRHPIAQLLSPEEIARAEKFLLPQDRNNFISCRMVLRLSLSRKIPGVAPRDFVISTNSLGKPILIWPNIAYQFNIAHSGCQAVVAITSHGEIGVDIEVADRQTKFRTVSESVMSEEERRALAHCSDDMFARKFLEMWTLKEAYIKATGQGMRLPLAKISFNISGRDGDQIEVQFDHPIVDKADHWSFQLQRTQDNAIVALAIKDSTKQRLAIENKIIDLSIPNSMTS